VFGLVGIAFLGAAIATVTSSIVNSEVEAIQVAKEHSRKRFKEIFDDMPAVLKTLKRTPISEQDAQYEKARVSSIAVSDVAPSVLRRGLLAAGSTLPSLFMVFAGGALVHRLNGGTGPWWDAVYYSVVTGKKRLLIREKRNAWTRTQLSTATYTIRLACFLCKLPRLGLVTFLQLLDEPGSRPSFTFPWQSQELENYCRVQPRS